MIYKDLIDNVALIIQDPTFTRDIIGSYLNQAQLEIAGGMQSTLGSWITPELPNLFTIDTITTSVDLAYVDLPIDFHRSLQFAASSKGYEIDIANSFISFSETYPLLNKTGNISEIIAFGGSLYYQGIPSIPEDITIHYYKVPTDMVADDDEPSCLPLHLQRPLLVNHAVWKLYELIEDDLTKGGQNIQQYQTIFNQALRLLELSVSYDTKIMDIM